MCLLTSGRRSGIVRVPGKRLHDSANRRRNARVMKALFRIVFPVLLAHVALRPAAGQENPRGAWRAANNDCFIQTFVLGDQGRASVSYGNGAGEQPARWTWGRAGLNIVSDARGVLLMDGHYEDTVLVAEVDYSTTDDIDFRTCRFTR